MNIPLRIGDRYFRLIERFVNRHIDLILRFEKTSRRNPVAHSDFDGIISEFLYPYNRFVLTREILKPVDDRFDDLDRFFGIITVRYADARFDDAVIERVDDHLPDHVFIGDCNQLFIFRPKRRISELDLFDDAVDVVDRDRVPELKRAGNHQRYPRREIGDRPLQRQTRRQKNGTDRRDKRGDGDTEFSDRDDKHRTEYQNTDDVGRKLAQRDIKIVGIEKSDQHVIDVFREKPSDGHNDNGTDDLKTVVCQKLDTQLVKLLNVMQLLIHRLSLAIKKNIMPNNAGFGLKSFKLYLFDSLYNDSFHLINSNTDGVPMRRIALITLVLSSIAGWGNEHTLGTTGYARLQTSFQDDKADVCFKAPGAGSKYRLGNECETWIELGLYDRIRFDNGVTMHNQIRPVFTGTNNKNIDYLRLDELYTEFSGIFDDNSVSFWAGRRFYERYDSHMSDHFFFNMSGDGAGFRNLDINGYRLSYSYMFDRLDPPSADGGEKVHFDSHDLRLSKTVPRGEWTLFANRMQLHSKTFNAMQRVDDSIGYAAGFLYKDTRLTKEIFGMDGENMSGLFYGKGVAKSAGSASPYMQETMIDTILSSPDTIENALTWRFINTNAFENEEWGLMSNFVYETRRETEYSETDQIWISAGIRPYWFFHKNGRFVLETGIDRVENKTTDQIYTLTKTTAALEAALDKGVWKRPVLRLFYTYADWSESAARTIGTPYYANQTHGDNFGIQLEYWW